MPPPSYITISRSEYLSLLAETRSSKKWCQEVSKLRLALQTVGGRLVGRVDRPTMKLVEDAVQLCLDVSKFSIELAAFERRLEEFDQEITPLRPPSRTDIQAAFDNAVDFASGKKKPPSSD